MTNPTLDPLLSLAFSVHSNPGVYAVLVGSGLSRAAAIPTGWEIVLDLARKVAVLEGEAQLATLETSLSIVDLEVRRLEREAHKRLEALNAEFDTAPQRARNVLAALTAGEKLQVSPVNGRFKIEGPIAVPELLLSGTEVPDCVASPARFELAYLP